MLQEKKEQLKDLGYMLSAVHSPDGAASDPYVLFLGGSTSTIQGRPFLDELRQQVLLARLPGRQYTKEDIENMSLAEQISNFDQRWKNAPPPFRINRLNALYQKVTPNEGHDALSLLLKEHYFSLILTTTIDQLTESVFISSVINSGRLPSWRILVNGYNAPENFRDVIQPSTSTPSSDTVFLKLCGGIRNFAATRQEVEHMLKPIENSVGEALKRDIIIVGPTLLDDFLLQHVFESANNDRSGSIYIINTEDVTPELQDKLYPWRPTYIIDKDITFDSVFQTIIEPIGLVQDAEKFSGGSLSQEELERLRKLAQNSETTVDALIQYIKGSTPTSTNAPTVDTPEPKEAPIRTEREIPPPTEVYGEHTVAPPPTNAETPLVELIPAEDDENALTKNEPVKSGLIELEVTTLMTINMNSDLKVNFTARGPKLNRSGNSPNVAKINPGDLNNVMQYLSRDIAALHRLNTSERQELEDSWRSRAAREGIAFSTNLIQSFPDLDKALDVALQTAIDDNPENVSLVFDGPLQFLGMPYELLYYRDVPLALSYPLSRRVSGVNVRQSETLDIFFRNLRQKRGNLRVLLIASGTPETTVDEQIIELKEQISKAVQQQLNHKPTIDLLPSHKATIGEVRKRLRNCSYHIVHYAGQTAYDATTGANSGLRLWERENRSGQQVILSAQDIATLLGASETRLFYLNSSVGVWTGTEQLLTGENIGLMDAIVKAGIPYVLGFRWYVTHNSSRTFARMFYERLFRKPFVPERAVLHARQSMSGNQGLDVWASPILVAQTPYH